MSIILDALRKSERERRLGQIPTLDSAAAPPAAPRRVATAVFVVTMVALLAGGTYWWTQHRPMTAIATAPTAPGISRESPVPTPETPAGIGAPERGAAGPLAVGEPPAAQRAARPPLTLNALSWAENGTRRFAMINQTIVREGQSLPGGIVLREVTREAAILEHQGQRFELRP